MPDYSPYLNSVQNAGIWSGLAEGLKSGLMSYRDEKRNQRDDAQKDRQYKLDLLKSGFEETPTGDFQESKLHQSQQRAKSDLEQKKFDLENRNKENQIGLQNGYLFDRDVNGQIDPTKTKKIPGFLSREDRQDKLEQGRLNRQQNTLDSRLGLLDRQNAYRSHNKVLTALNNDPQLKQEFQAISRVDNAANLVINSKVSPPQQINELQQAIRNAASQGQSGVAERAADYFHSVGMSAADAQQFLTGDPVDVARNGKLVSHLKELSQHIIEGNKALVAGRIDSITEGNGYIYDDPRFNDLKGSLDQKVNALKKQAAHSQAFPGPGEQASANEKIVDGVSYKKVPGGWEEAR